MWDRALFALRRAVQGSWGGLASWRLSIVLMILAALYHGLLAVWARSSSSGVVQSIAGLLPFWIVYGLLVANTAACIWRRLHGLVRETAAGPVLALGPAETEMPASVATPEEAAAELRRRGYRVTRRGESTVHGVRRRFAAAGSPLFHAALILAGAGWLLTWGLRQETRAWVAEGETYEGRDEQILDRSHARLASGAPAPVAFTVDEIRPEFWADRLLFTRLEAEVDVGGRKATTGINRPMLLGIATFARLSGFGYAPRWELRDRVGRVVDSAFVKLRVFPPGQRDSFQMEGLPHRVHLEVLPDAVIEDGQLVTRSVALVHPVLLVRVMRGRLEVASGSVRPGEAIEVEGLRLSFPEIHYWGEMAIVSDPGAPLVLGGFALALVGLAIRLRGRRREAEWQAAPGGGTWRTWGGGLEDGPDTEAR